MFPDSWGSPSRMLEEEAGWSASVTDLDEGTVLEVTAGSAADAGRIRALGYIGLMTTGSHRRLHHWLIATGGQAPVHQE